MCVCVSVSCKTLTNPSRLGTELKKKKKKNDFAYITGMFVHIVCRLCSGFVGIGILFCLLLLGILITPVCAQMDLPLRQHFELLLVQWSVV